MTTATGEPRQAPEPSDPRSNPADLRPQVFGDGSPGRVPDPVIEPLWTGIRALATIEAGAAIDARTVTLTDEDGDPIDGHDDILVALAEAAQAEQFVVDGFLTKLAARDGSGVYVGMDELPIGRPARWPCPPSVSAAIGPKRPSSGWRRNGEARTFGPDDAITFVAIDLLWLDGESMLEVPFLERRRILESVLRGIGPRSPRHVRPATRRHLDRIVACPRVLRAQLQGRERPLPAGRHEPRLGHGADAPPLSGHTCRTTVRRTTVRRTPARAGPPRTPTRPAASDTIRPAGRPPAAVVR